MYVSSPYHVGFGSCKEFNEVQVKVDRSMRLKYKDHVIVYMAIMYHYSESKLKSCWKCTSCIAALVVDYCRHVIFRGDLIFVGSNQPRILNPRKFEHNKYGVIKADEILNYIAFNTAITVQV